MKFPNAFIREREERLAVVLRAGADRPRVGRMFGVPKVDHNGPFTERNLDLPGGWGLRAFFGVGGAHDICRLSVGPADEPHFGRKVVVPTDYLGGLARLAEQIARRDPGLQEWHTHRIALLRLSGLGPGVVLGGQIPIGRAWETRLLAARTGRAWMSTGPAGDLHAIFAIPLPADQLAEVSSFLWAVLKARERCLEKEAARVQGCPRLLKRRGTG